MKIAAVVILYKPEEIGLDIIKSNILSYSGHVDKLYLIDNSPSPSSALKDEFDGCFYYHNNNKNGIAGAQNYGCKKAKEDGYEWVMTMDQDSRFDEEQISKYFDLIEQHSGNKENGSFTLNFRISYPDVFFMTLPQKIRILILSPIKNLLLRKKNEPSIRERMNRDHEITTFAVGDAISYPKVEVAASCNVINLAAWESINGFDDELFIDQVDNDFSIRLCNAGYKIVRFNNVSVNHNIGEFKFSLLKKHTPYYSPFRLYYIFRNHLIMMKKHDEHQYFFRNAFNYYLQDNCFKSIHGLKNLRIFIKAYRDYKKYCKKHSI